MALSRAGQAGAAGELFDLFDGFLKNKGYLARGGQIIDATIVSAPKQHNSREDNVARIVFAIMRSKTTYSAVPA